LETGLCKSMDPPNHGVFLLQNGKAFLMFCVAVFRGKRGWAVWWLGGERAGGWCKAQT
jgi:hypothetical protein